MNPKARAMILTTAAALVVSVPLSAAQSSAAKPSTAKPATAKPATARVITLKATDDMKYDVTSITARPGEALLVKVVSVGKIPKFAMAHNFVLLTKGANAKAFADQAMQAKATNHIPPALKKQVVASTGLAGPGETVQVAFKAPTAPGKYEFICSFPGHYAAGMKGVLIVSAKPGKS